jgi:hypothetical protein
MQFFYWLTQVFSKFYAKFDLQHILPVNCLKTIYIKHKVILKSQRFNYWKIKYRSF